MSFFVLIFVTQVKGLVACCHSFCLFYLLSYNTWFLMDIRYMMKLEGDDLRGNGDFQDVVMTNLLGSGCLQVKVNSQ